MKKFKFKILGLAAVLCLALASTATAKPGGHYGGYEGPGWGGPGVQLTDEQLAQYTQMHEKHRTTIEPILQQMITKQAEFDALMIGENPDPAKVESIAKEIGNLEAKLVAERVKLYGELGQQGLPRHHSGKGYGHKGFGHGGGGWHKNYDGPCPRWQN